MTKPFNLETHNGCLTLFNPATGNHRTIRVITQKKDANFAAGERVIQLLTGPDNTRSYTGFGFVKEGGKINVWRKKQGTEFDRYADMVEHPEKYQEVGIEYKFEGRCRVCNRLLTDPESIELGVGPVCRGGR